MLEAAASDEFAVQPALAARHAGPWRRPSMRLTASFIALTCLGLVMAVSAVGSGSLAPALFKRLALTTLGVCAFVLGAQVRYQWWRRHHLAALGVALTGLGATLIPGIGMQINGARRWINVGLPIGFQPSEFAKIALCIWVAAYCARNATRMRDPLHGFLVPCAVIAFASLLILCEPDFGTAVLTGALCMTILVASGTRLIYVLIAGAAAMPLLQRLVFSEPYRLQRVLTFLDPWSDPRGSGYQLIQSKIAIGSGGLFGLGLGAGHQKVGFLLQHPCRGAWADRFSACDRAVPVHPLGRPEGRAPDPRPLRLRAGAGAHRAAGGTGRSPHRRGHRFGADKGPQPALHQRGRLLPDCQHVGGRHPRQHRKVRRTPGTLRAQTVAGGQARLRAAGLPTAATRRRGVWPHGTTVAFNTKGGRR